MSERAKSKTSTEASQSSAETPAEGAAAATHAAEMQNGAPETPPGRIGVDLTPADIQKQREQLLHQRAEILKQLAFARLTHNDSEVHVLDARLEITEGNERFLADMHRYAAAEAQDRAAKRLNRVLFWVTILVAIATVAQAFFAGMAYYAPPPSAQSASERPPGPEAAAPDRPAKSPPTQSELEPAGERAPAAMPPAAPAPAPERPTEPTPAPSK